MIPPSSWNPFSKNKILQIVKTQRKAARWTTSDFSTWSIVTAMLEKLGWGSLQQRRADALLCVLSSSVSSTDLWQYLCLDITSPTPVCPNIATPPMAFRQVHTSADYNNNSFYPLAIVQWNALPEWVVCLPTLDAFKEAVGKLHHFRP